MELLKTPLYDWHVGLGARMVEFAGWLMPVQYRSIIEEHTATRQSLGIFDVSHMGRFYFFGSRVDTALDRLTTRRVAGMEPGRIRYSLMTNEQGGILDDVLVYHLDAERGQSAYMMVVNAGNREKIRKWIELHLGTWGISIEDRTRETAMIAVQGPAALATVAQLTSFDPAQLRYYTGRNGEVAGAPAVISRTGYTGEDGCELIVPASRAEEIAQLLYELAVPLGGRVAGLGARDTLRLEAAMPLYGHELREDLNAAQTNLSFAINLNDRQFVGRDAIAAAQQQGNLPVRIGLEVEGKRAAREGTPILMAGQRVGEVTSGTFAPTLEKSIAMGYVQPSYSAPGNELFVDLRGKVLPARVVQLPFYSRTSTSKAN